MKLFLLAVTTLVAFLPLAARTIYVSAAAGSDGDGSKAKPFAKIQQGLDIAMPGDTVELASGIYYERIKFPRSNVRLNGPRTAVIDGAVRFEQKWKKIPEYGPNAWHTKVPAVFFPKEIPHRGSGLVIAPDGLIIQLYEQRVGNLEKAAKENNNIWYAPYLMTKGIGKSKMKFIKALAMYRAKHSDVIVSFGDGRDVSKANLEFSTPLPTVVIDGADRCTVSGITIRHSRQGILIKNSAKTLIEDCRIMRSEHGIALAEGSEKCVIRFCDISMDTIFGCDPWQRGSWDAWKGHKLGGFWDRIAVNIANSKGGHKIHDNYLHNHWGGIQDYGDNPDLDIHHNRIDKIEDDALEPNGTERNCRWHHNHVTDSRCAIRIKCIQTGPMYAYANVFHNNKEDCRNFKSHQYPDAVAFLYHNTGDAYAGVKSHGVKMPPGVKNFHYFNNLFFCDVIYAGTNALNWHDAGNVYVCRNPKNWQKSINEAKKHGFKSTSKFVEKQAPGIKNFAAGDVSLLSGSPAIKAGIDLSKYNLPGCEEFKSRDAGAVSFGSPMFKTFRKKSELPASDLDF